MIEAWHIWEATIDEHTSELVLVVSSPFALRANLTKLVTVVPITDQYRDLDYRVHIEHPEDGKSYWVVTEQLRTITAVMRPVNWSLTDHEVGEVKHALRHMVAF